MALFGIGRGSEDRPNKAIGRQMLRDTVVVNTARKGEKKKSEREGRKEGEEGMERGSKREGRREVG